MGSDDDYDDDDGNDDDDDDDDVEDDAAGDEDAIFSVSEEECGKVDTGSDHRTSHHGRRSKELDFSVQPGWFRLLLWQEIVRRKHSCFPASCAIHVVAAASPRNNIHIFYLVTYLLLQCSFRRTRVLASSARGGGRAGS